MTKYKINSTSIKFSDSCKLHYKTEGVGIAPEMVTSPKFWGTYFSIKLTPSEWLFIKNHRIVEFQTYGEKESIGKDVLKRQAGKKLQTAFYCFE
jgi:hypothetical protein